MRLCVELSPQIELSAPKSNSPYASFIGSNKNMLPKRIGRPRSGILRGPRREWPRHRAWVRRHACVVPNCQVIPVQFAHIRSAANSGKSLKPADWYGVSMCWEHHREQHQIGQPAFERRYGLDLFALAAEFAQRSADLPMRDYLKQTEVAS